MATKKTNPIRKLITTVEGFEEKRKKDGISLDLPTQNQYDGIVHYLEYMDEAMEKDYKDLPLDDRIELDYKDLAQLIYTQVIDFYNKLCTVAFFLTSGKFAEHKEADYLESERKQISDGLDAIAEELYGAVVKDEE